MIKAHWAFIVAVALQVVIVAAVPARVSFTRFTGKTVFLKTAPIDPYDIMSGYYVTLSYEISIEENLPPGPGLDQGLKSGQHVYIVLQEGEDGIWDAIRASTRWPEDVPSGAVVIKGEKRRRRGIEFGIESYYIPEGKGEEIEAGLLGNRDTTRVEVKVDRFGNAALIRLHIGGVTYEY
jgi:uncharacterized membrane-anchored protein